MRRRTSLTKQESQDLERFQEELAQRRLRQRTPQRISEVVSRWLSRRGYGQLRSTSELRDLWKTAVGPQMAPHSRPGTLRRGVLEVLVRNSTVLQELTFQKKQLLKQLSRSGQKTQFEDLRFRIGAMEDGAEHETASPRGQRRLPQSVQSTND